MVGLVVPIPGPLGKKLHLQTTTSVRGVTSKCYGYVKIVSAIAQNNKGLLVMCYGSCYAVFNK